MSEFSDVNNTFVGRSEVYSTTNCKACAQIIIVGGLETSQKTRNHLREEPHVGLSDSIVEECYKKHVWNVERRRINQSSHFCRLKND